MMAEGGPPRLLAIVDCERAPFSEWLARLEPLLAAALPARVVVMLRDRQLPVRERRRMGEALRRLTAERQQLLSVNDRLDLAALLGADAVHLSEASVSVEDARAFAGRMGRSWWISRACHDPEAAATSTADALLLSPIVEGRKGRPALGARGLSRARSAACRRPGSLGPCALYALGGVTDAHVGALLSAGADGVAVVGAALDARASRALVEGLGIAR